jgi:hypothetical protein
MVGAMVALGFGITWVSCLLRVLAAMVLLGGVAALLRALTMQ